MHSSQITVDPAPALWVIGMTAAPRPQPRVERSIGQLRQAGFVEPVHIFAEPGTKVTPMADVFIHQNARRLGVWLNWRSAATYLLQTTNAPWIVLCQDDIDLCSCAGPALRHALACFPKTSWGFASLFTSRRTVEGQTTRPGWQAFDVGRNAVGALAYCFSRESLQAVLSHEGVLRYRLNHGIDAVVSQAFQEMGRHCYYHLPSLCAHTGDGNSTKGDFVFTGRPGPPEFAPVGFSADYGGYVANPAKSSVVVR